MMNALQYDRQAQAGDLVQLVGRSHKYFLVRLVPGGELQTHRGIIKHNDLIGCPFGKTVYSHLGNPFHLLTPSLADLIHETKRNTQILYPKDIGFILVTMGIGPGRQVLEAGTGSGALTTAFAFAVGDTGHVFTYEKREEMHHLAVKNLTKLGLAGRVTFKLKDIETGFEETNVDAVFLDVQNPQDYIAQVRESLRPGGFFGAIVPTFNQVPKLLHALNEQDFAYLEMCEILLRYYRANPERLRPVDRMVAHTGFLVFGRPISDPILGGRPH